MKPNIILISFWCWSMYLGACITLLIISIELMNLTFMGVLSVCIGWGAYKNYNYGKRLEKVSLIR